MPPRHPCGSLTKLIFPCVFQGFRFPELLLPNMACKTTSRASRLIPRASKTFPRASITAPPASKTPPKSLRNTPKTPPETVPNRIIHNVFQYVRFPGPSGGHLCSTWPSKPLQSLPKRLRDTPKTVQDTPKFLQRVPESFQAASKSRPKWPPA